jgi:hypothetical protein
MDLTRYSAMKAKGKVALTKEFDASASQDRYYVNFNHYDHHTGEVLEVIKREVTLAMVQQARSDLNNETAVITAKRASLLELINDAQAL